MFQKEPYKISFFFKKNIHIRGVGEFVETNDHPSSGHPSPSNLGSPASHETMGLIGGASDSWRFF